MLSLTSPVVLPWPSPAPVPHAISAFDDAAFRNKILCGDSLQLLPQMPDLYFAAAVIDPPYGEQMGYDGDGSPEEAEELLYAFLRALEPKLTHFGHVLIFWNNHTNDRVIDALKSTGFSYRRTLNMYIPKGGARPYRGWLPRTQAIIVGQRAVGTPRLLHRELSPYIAAARERKGLTNSSLAKLLGCDNRLVMKWTRPDDPAWCLPTPRFYKAMKELLDLDDQFDFMLGREPSHPPSENRHFSFHHDTYVVDASMKEERFHPSQKPLAVVRHCVECVALPGEVVLDGFSGSGTTAIACEETGRDFVCIEKSPIFSGDSNERLRAHRKAASEGLALS